MNLPPELYLIALILIVVFFVRKNKRKSNNQYTRDKYSQIQGERKSDEITINKTIINAEDEMEEYSLKKCPYCQEEINIDAIKCKHCGEEVGKGYVINEDGTCVANKIQGARTSVQSEVLVHHNQPMSGGQVFFRVVWITLLVIFIWVVVQLGACAAIIGSLG